MYIDEPNSTIPIHVSILETNETTVKYNEPFGSTTGNTSQTNRTTYGMLPNQINSINPITSKDLHRQKRGK